MLLTQVFVYCALEQESLLNYCGYFILFELNKCYVDTNIVLYNLGITHFTKTIM